MKTILITGSTSGIGLGIAQAFLKENYSLMLHGIENEQDIRPLLTSLQASSSVFYCQADVSNQEGCSYLISQTLKHFDSIDVLVNNAGVQYVAPVVDFPEDKWQTILNINLSAYFILSKAVLPLMYSKKWGRLIHIASTHGLVASPHKAAYVAAKHGVIGLSKVIALEAAGSGVTSNAVCPGWVLTPLVKKQIEMIAAEKNISFDQAQKILLEKQPSGEFVTPEDLGSLALFLASSAANQMTGSALVMDGGWTAC